VVPGVEAGGHGRTNGWESWQAQFQSIVTRVAMLIARMLCR
jgi:hypothetical protein